MSEEWDEYKRITSEYRKVKNRERTDKLKKFAERFNITLNNFAENSFRLEKEGKPTIDYYPPSGKAYLHNTHKWVKIEHLFHYLQKIYSNE